MFLKRAVLRTLSLQQNSQPLLVSTTFPNLPGYQHATPSDSRSRAAGSLKTASKWWSSLGYGLRSGNCQSAVRCITVLRSGQLCEYGDPHELLCLTAEYYYSCHIQLTPICL